jgi:hypothetical protein
LCRGTGTAPKRVACQNGKERTAGILGKGEDIDGRKIIYDGGRSGNRIKGIKVQSLSGCKGIEHRIAETRVYDSSGACKYYFLS